MVGVGFDFFVSKTDIRYSEVIKQANDSPYGLASAVFTANISRAISATQKLQAGTVWVTDSFMRTFFGIRFIFVAGQLHQQTSRPSTVRWV